MKIFRWIVLVFLVGIFSLMLMMKGQSSVRVRSPDRLEGKWEAVVDGQHRFVILKRCLLDFGIAGRPDHFYRVRTVKSGPKPNRFKVTTSRGRCFKFNLTGHRLVWRGYRFRSVDVIE